MTTNFRSSKFFLSHLRGSILWSTSVGLHQANIVTHRFSYHSYNEVIHRLVDNVLTEKCLTHEADRLAELAKNPPGFFSLIPLDVMQEQAHAKQGKLEQQMKVLLLISVIQRTIAYNPDYETDVYGKIQLPPNWFRRQG